MTARPPVRDAGAWPDVERSDGRRDTMTILAEHATKVAAREQQTPAHIPSPGRR